MKIRTGFVTNSSSSSFVSVIVNTQNGDSFGFGSCDAACNDEEYSFPEVVDGKLVYERWNDETDCTDTIEIKSVAELMEVLFEFSGIEVTEEYEESLNIVQGLEFKDIENIVLKQADSSWEGDFDFDGDEDMLDEDGMFATEYELDLTEL